MKQLLLTMFLVFYTCIPAFSAEETLEKKTNFTPQILKLQIQKTTPDEKKQDELQQVEEELKAEIEKPKTFKARAWKFIKGQPEDDNVILGMWSYHSLVPNHHDFNEENEMFGVEYKGYTFSTFKNSFFERTYFAGVARKVWEKKFNKYMSVDLQYKAGLMHGYGSRYPNLAGITPLALPSVGITVMKVGFDLTIIPSDRPIFAGNFRIGIPKGIPKIPKI